jgi:hypothetical protein
MNSFAGWVTACIAHYRCHRYIRRAVDSLLSQSYPWIRVVVVNDGDPRPPWRELESITDPRLLRFHLNENRGLYFCFEIARLATPDPFFMIQDADDWSAPPRAACLLRALQRDSSDLAVSAEHQFVESQDGPRVVEVRWRDASRETDAGRFVVHHHLTPAYKHRAPHHGIFRSSSLRAIGGYYAGLRISHDTLVTNLILMTGRISHIAEGLYFRLLRADSLTHAPSTGTGSASAKRELDVQRYLYQLCFSCYRLFLEGRLTSAQLSEWIQQIHGTYVSDEDRAALDLNVRRLREMMK